MQRAAVLRLGCLQEQMMQAPAASMSDWLQCLGSAHGEQFGLDARAAHMAPSDQGSSTAQDAASSIECRHDPASIQRRAIRMQQLTAAASSKSILQHHTSAHVPPQLATTAPQAATSALPWRPPTNKHQTHIGQPRALRTYATSAHSAAASHHDPPGMCPSGLLASEVLQQVEAERDSKPGVAGAAKSGNGPENVAQRRQGAGGREDAERDALREALHVEDEPPLATQIARGARLARRFKELATQRVRAELAAEAADSAMASGATGADGEDDFSNVQLPHRVARILAGYSIGSEATLDRNAYVLWLGAQPEEGVVDEMIAKIEAFLAMSWGTPTKLGWRSLLEPVCI